MNVVGSGDYTYQLVEGWGRRLPEGVVVGQTSVVTDSEGLVYLFNRSRHPLIVLTPDGEFVTSWGQGVLSSAHGMYLDDNQDLWLPLQYGHAVLKYDRAGNHLMTIGTVGQASDPNWWGDEEVGQSQLEETILAGPPARPAEGRLPDYPLYRAVQEPIAKAFPPFTCPTDVARALNGDIFVTDGYGNARVHRFSAEGELLHSWGAPGREAPGEFHVPHGIWVTDDGRVLVADSRNERVQVFDTDGTFLYQWDGLHYPCDFYVDGEVCYLAEMGSMQHHAGGAFISVRDLDGRVLSSWGAPNDAGAHALWVDKDGAIYVNQNLAGERILKYRRV